MSGYDEITKLCADIINHKIGNKDLQDHCAEMERLVDELANDRDGYVQLLTNENNKLRAEVERLRAALELFACDCIDSGNLCPSPQNCRNYIARAALEEKQ